MTGIDDILLAIKAGYSLFYCQTKEIQRIVPLLVKGIEDSDSIVNTAKVWDLEANKDPDAVVESLYEGKVGTALIAKNFQWFMYDDYGKPDKTIVTFFQNNAESFSTVDNRQVLIIVSTEDFGNAIPTELQREFMNVEFSLPNVEEITTVYDSILEAAKGNSKFKKPNEQQKQSLLDAAKGMTLAEITKAFSMSIVKNKGIFCSETVAEIRASDVEKTAGLKIGNYPQTFETLKGYSNVKDFTSSTIRSKLSKGIMLLGPPGVGKTHFCRCLGNESGLKVFELEVAELFGGLVGESEKLMKMALEVVSVNSPCILFIDELEKALSGVGGGSQSGDNGTTKRSVAQLLKFLSDNRPEGIYVVATCNDISGLPPEWIRAGRWDATFFVDLPNTEEKKEILRYYQKKFGVTGSITMDGWTGAEIQTCCRISKMMSDTSGEKYGLADAEKYVVPISKTMDTEIANLRKWAEDRTIPATYKPGKQKRGLGRKDIRNLEM